MIADFDNDSHCYLTWEKEFFDEIQLLPFFDGYCIIAQYNNHGCYGYVFVP